MESKSREKSFDWDRVHVLHHVNSYQESLYIEFLES